MIVTLKSISSINFRTTGRWGSDEGRDYLDFEKACQNYEKWSLIFVIKIGFSSDTSAYRVICPLLQHLCLTIIKISQPKLFSWVLTKSCYTFLRKTVIPSKFLVKHVRWVKCRESIYCDKKAGHCWIHSTTAMGSYSRGLKICYVSHSRMS